MQPHFISSWFSPRRGRTIRECLRWNAGLSLRREMYTRMCYFSNTMRQLEGCLLSSQPVAQQRSVFTLGAQFRRCHANVSATSPFLDVSCLFICLSVGQLIATLTLSGVGRGWLCGPLTGNTSPPRKTASSQPPWTLPVSLISTVSAL